MANRPIRASQPRIILALRPDRWVIRGSGVACRGRERVAAQLCRSGTQQRTDGLSCRLYWSEDGWRGAPTVAQVVHVLAARVGFPRVPALDLFDDADLDPDVAAAVRRITVAGFGALWSGRRVTTLELAGSDTAAAAAAVRHLAAGGRIECSDDGWLVAVHGLARRPTPHRIEHEGGVVNTWCAFDAIGIPAALAITARALTRCPSCGRPLSVSIAAGAPDPFPEWALWYPQDRTGRLVDEFCSGANLFCSVEHLERWRDGHPGPGQALTVGEVARLGRSSWSDVAGPVL